MHEGNKIRELLEERGKKPADLAKAAHRSWPAIDKQLKQETLGAGAWETISKGLIGLQIDPGLVRPLRSIAGFKQAADLRPLIDDFSLRQLHALKVILESEAEAQKNLHLIVDDRLARDHYQHTTSEERPDSLLRVSSGRGEALLPVSLEKELRDEVERRKDQEQRAHGQARQQHTAGGDRPLKRKE